MTPTPIFPGLLASPQRPAITFGDRTLSYGELVQQARALSAAMAGHERVALLADPSMATCVATVAALASGVTVVPLNPSQGSRELQHILSDSRPTGVVADRAAKLPPALAQLELIASGPSHPSPPETNPSPGGTSSGRADPERADLLRDDFDAEHTAVILYTSGTTGLPKGVLIPRRAVASNLDAIAGAWQWTDEDRLVHALPLFHVHGLLLGVVGPLRLGAQIEHLGRFSVRAVEAAFTRGATMMFGVPTMYHRIAEEAAGDPGLAAPLRKARLLVSGSAGLPTVVHERIRALTGQAIVERYGMTETLMSCAIHALGDRRPGYVGPPVDGVEVMLLDESGSPIGVSDDETVGELHVRGPNVFLGYLNQQEATASAVMDGWFATGDIATRAADGYIRIVGRKSTDLIKSGGYRIGAGEIEAALLEHEAVAEAAVTGESDPDLGQRVVAWVVLRADQSVDAKTLAEHVGELLSSHKRPREVRFLERMPRNAMGKVVKQRLAQAASGSTA